MKRLDDQTEERYVKACIYGPPGTGKTSFGVTAPKPLIALTERQGMSHVRKAAARLGVPVPQTLFIETANDLRNLTRALHGDRKQPFAVYESHGDGEKKERIKVHEGEWPETIVLDSATDACRLLIDEIRRQSPPTIGKDGLPVDSQRFWNVLIMRAQAMILAIRDLPLHAVFLALADDRESGDDDNKIRSLKPQMATKQLSHTLAAAVNVVGFTYRTTRRGEAKANGGREENRIEYGVVTTGPEYMTTKPYRPLRDREVPDFSYWIRVINGETNLLPAPLASQEFGGAELGAEDQPLTAGAGEQQSAPAETEQKEQASAPEEPKPSEAPAAASKPKKRRAG